MDNILCSGGAAGADVYWGDIAARHNHDVIHFSYDGHRSTASESIIYRLNTQELSIADAEIKTANRTLKRRIPISKQWLYNLLRRNWYQVRDADSVYAVGYVIGGAKIRDLSTAFLAEKIPARKNEDILCVKGGTSWAIQMFCDRKINGNVYLYDQSRNKILLTNPLDYKYWLDIGHMKDDKIIVYSDQYTIPKPSGVYAAIGTRDLNDNGRLFIEAVYNQ